jgi:hypothetical protein
MRSEEIIKAWVESRRDAEIGEDVSDRVMGMIYDYEEKKAAPLFDIRGFVEPVINRVFTKPALVVAGFIGGFLRVCFTFYVLLF